MSQTLDIAVIGATGTVGETLVQILEERDFPIGACICWPAANPPAVRCRTAARTCGCVKSMSSISARSSWFFAAGPAATLSYAARATAAGCSIIDLSGALPAEQAPQVVPEANASVLAGLKKPFQVSSPSPAATTLAVLLAPCWGCSICNAST